MGGGDLMNYETSRMFFGHVNFPEMNKGISVYVWISVYVYVKQS